MREEGSYQKETIQIHRTHIKKIKTCNSELWVEETEGEDVT
jgi:hypothetical protein